MPQEISKEELYIAIGRLEMKYCNLKTAVVGERDWTASGDEALLVARHHKFYYDEHRSLLEKYNKLLESVKACAKN